MAGAINLPFINELERNLDSPSGLLQVLLGPRQVGKTTTVLKFINEKLKGKALYVSADEVFNPDRAWLTEQWSQATSEEKTLFVDEIQKCYGWASTLKGLYDKAKREETPIRCVLLGSSSLDIQKGLNESLTGRFQLLRAFHWNFAESAKGYGVSFDEYLKFGGYPGAYQFINKPEWANFVQNSIVSTVVEKDILLFHRVKNPALFRQAFQILMSYPAQEVSFTKLLGQLQDRGNVEVIKYYISLYEGAYLIKTLEKFSKKPQLRRSSSPKVLPLAPCLSYLQVKDEYAAEERGRVFEVVVGSQLVRTGEPLYYWREGKDEVDFVLQSGRTIYAIEVKSGKSHRSNGLAAFQEKFREARGVIITPENYFDFESNPLTFLSERSI